MDAVDQAGIAGAASLDLEGMIVAVREQRRQPVEFLKSLVDAEVYLLLNKPWDGRSVPEEGSSMLLVTDWGDRSKAMLAVFTDAAKAQDFTTLAEGFSHVVRVPGPVAFLGVAPDQGIIVNPNDRNTFRVTVEAAAQVRGAIQERLQRLIGDASDAVPLPPRSEDGNAIS